jgi:hypothetical protein
MKRNNRIELVLILLVLFLPLTAQESKVVSDLGLWTGVSLEKSLKKDWTFSLKQEVRFKEDISTLNNVFTQAGVRYRLNRNFALEGKYRITWDKDKDGSMELMSRYSFDLRFKGRLDYISIYYRLRYQKEVKGMDLISLDEPYEKYLRNRLQIRYTDLKKIEPYLSAEIFQLFEPYQIPKFHYTRFLIGVRYHPGKIGSFNFAYGINRELNSTLPATYYIFKLNYTYAF